MKLSIIFLVLLFHLIDAYYVDVRINSLSILTKNVHTCKSNNVFCAPNCLSIAKCINGIIRTIYTCQNGQFCTDDIGPPVCGERMGLKCFATIPNIFKCAGLGFFPDVIECNKYHFCYRTDSNGGTGITTSTTPEPDVLYDPSTNYIYTSKFCSANTTYAPPTATCEPSSRPCPTSFPVRLCKSPGETFQVAGPIYVICLQYSNDQRILYPFQYRCKVNKFPCPFP